MTNIKSLKPLYLIAAVIITHLSSPSAFASETAADHPPAIIVEKPAANDLGLIFERNGQPEMLTRPQTQFTTGKRDSASTTETKARTITQALVDGPNDQESVAGFKPFLPEGTTLDKADLTKANTIKIYLDIPQSFIESGEYTNAFVEDISHNFMESLLDHGISTFYFYVKDHHTSKYKPIREFLPDFNLTITTNTLSQHEDIPPPPPLTGVTPKSLSTQNGFVTGALTGKRVVLNQSHGWYDNTTTLNRWAVQRSLTWQVLEDFGSAMFVNHYVIPMLQNAGAIARPVRESDTQSNMAIVDNAMGAPKYVETGTEWFFSSLNGYTHKTTYSGRTDNPFGSGQTTRLVPGTTGAAYATATFTPTVPATGFYNVYICYAAGSDRTPNAHFQVYHSGGVTDFRIDQTITGATWFLLGSFYFEQGAPATKAKVVALNDSGDTKYLNVDAVRFGGGMGNVARRTHGVSGRPRWQEEATNYLQFNGMLNSGIMQNYSSSSDMSLGFGNRPLSAQWEQSRDGLGNDLVYIGWHTNATGWKCVGNVETQGNGRGTLIIRDVPGDASAATKNLSVKVRDGMLKSVQASFDSSWSSNGITESNGYGEANQSHLGNVAGFFFEGLFHDNISDSSAYKDGKFRYAAARGIVNGLIQYYGGTVFPPEPVTNFRVKNIGNGQVKLEWARGPVGNTTNRIGSAATSFRLYKSTNGYGFDNGTNMSNLLNYTTSLTPGETTFIRISAVNAAGISIPSETLAIRVPLSGFPTALIVNGYTRDDQYVAPMRSTSNIGGCTPPTGQYREMDPRKYQSRNYTIQHATAIASIGGYGIDSCSKDSINLSSYNLNTYPMVFWIGGQESEADASDGVDYTSIRPNERTAITNYLENGGNLFISGSEIAWDLGRSAASTAEKSFLSNYLKVNFSSDSSNTYSSNGNAGIFSGVGTFTYDNGSGDTYDVRFPDVLSPTGSSTSCMSYSGGTGGTSAIQYAGNFGSSNTPGKLIYMGFGFETINSSLTRANIMSRSINFFGVSSVSNWKEF